MTVFTTVAENLALLTVMKFLGKLVYFNQGDEGKFSAHFGFASTLEDIRHKLRIRIQSKMGLLSKKRLKQ
jgi:hypothetical protein